MPISKKRRDFARRENYEKTFRGYKGGVFEETTRTVRLSRPRPDLTKTCTNPILIQKNPTWVVLEDEWALDAAQGLEVRCRKCEGCHSARAALWVFRAIDCWRELAGPAYFVTLTYPLYYQGARVATPATGYVRSLSEAAGDLRRYLTNLRYLGRKHSGPVRASFKYLVSAEWTKKGQLHWHALILGNAANPASFDGALMRSQWPWFSKVASLVDGRSSIATMEQEVARKAGYVAKYLLKSEGDRPRGEGNQGRVFRVSAGFGGVEWRDSQRKRKGVAVVKYSASMRSMVLERTSRSLSDNAEADAMLRRSMPPSFALLLRG